MLVKTEIVVGEAVTEVFILSDPVTFYTPVYKVVNQSAEVTISDCLVCTDKVIFNGAVTENLIYKEQPDLATGAGRVFYHETRLPFSGFVVVPGAKPGDNCQVEFAGVKDCNFLVPLVADAAGIRIAVQKVIIAVKLKVTRSEQITL